MTTSIIVVTVLLLSVNGFLISLYRDCLKAYENQAERNRKLIETLFNRLNEERLEVNSPKKATTDNFLEKRMAVAYQLNNEDDDWG